MATPPPPLISAAFLAASRPFPLPSLCTLDTTFSNAAGCRCCCVLSGGGEGGGRCTLTITLRYIAMRNTTGNTQHHYASGARDGGSMLAAYVWLRINRYTRAHRLSHAHVSTCAIRSTPAINPLSPYPQVPRISNMHVPHTMRYNSKICPHISGIPLSSICSIPRVQTTGNT